PAFLNAQVERIGEDIDGIEADLLGHANAIGGIASRLCPRGIDESQFHGGSSLVADGSVSRLDSGEITSACPASSVQPEGVGEIAGFRPEPLFSPLRSSTIMTQVLAGEDTSPVGSRDAGCL